MEGHEVAQMSTEDGMLSRQLGDLAGPSSTLLGPGGDSSKCPQHQQAWRRVTQVDPAPAQTPALLT